VLIERRMFAALRQLDIAAKADVTAATIQRVEKGRWPIDAGTLERIVTAYGQLSVEPAHPERVWGDAVRKMIEWHTLTDEEVKVALTSLLTRDGRKHRVPVKVQRSERREASGPTRLRPR
jgi:transcriptional regulator with XRE-family HTH domain